MSRWIIPLNPAPNARIQLLCLPYAGGGSAVFRPWKNQLPASIGLSCVQLPGRETRFAEPPVTDITQMATQIMTELMPLLAKPYALFGHSMGALLAFELVRQLQSRQMPLPQHFFASGRAAPQRPRTLPPLQRLPDWEFVQALNERYGGIDPVVLQHQELLDLLLPALRADIIAVENYGYQPLPLPLGCPLTVYGGSHDPQVSPLDLQDWRIHTQQSFQVEILPGGHFFLNESRLPLLDSIAKILNG